MQLNQQISCRGGLSVPRARWKLPGRCLLVLCYYLSLHPISLRAGTGYSLVLHESKGTQDFTQSLIFETEGYLNTWKHFLGMLRWSSEIFFFFLASGAGRGKFVCLVLTYWDFNTERVYAKAEGTMPSSQNKTLTAT